VDREVPDMSAMETPRNGVQAESLVKSTTAVKTDDISNSLDLILEDDVAANLDQYILLSRQGYTKRANDFFHVNLQQHVRLFPVVMERIFHVFSVENLWKDHTWLTGFISGITAKDCYTQKQMLFLRLLRDVCRPYISLSSLQGVTYEVERLLAIKDLDEVEVSRL